MKKLSVLPVLLLFVCLGNVQAQTAKEMTRKQKKAEQELLDQALFDEAKQAITMKNFILEADHVIFKHGTSAFVSSNTNFVAVKDDKAVVQVAFNIPLAVLTVWVVSPSKVVPPTTNRLPTKKEIYSYQ